MEKINMRVMQFKHKELPFEKWNTNTFFAYLCDTHREVRGVDYFAARGKEVDKKMIKEFLAQYGRDLTKAFIDECLRQYKPSNSRYMVCTFQFMRTYMISTILPKLQLQAQRKEEAAKEQNFEEIQW